MSLFCYFWNLQQQQRKVMMLIRSRNYFKYIINARCSIRYNIIYLFYRWSSTQSSPFAVCLFFTCVSLRCAADSFGGNIIPFSRLHSSAFTKFAPCATTLTVVDTAKKCRWSLVECRKKFRQGHARDNTKRIAVQKIGLLCGCRTSSEVHSGARKRQGELSTK